MTRSHRPFSAWHIPCRAIGGVAILAVLVHSTASGAFTYLGNPPSKWNAGPNAASEHAFHAPAGPGLPGSATFSIAPAGLSAVHDADPSHGAFRSVDITALGVAGFDSAEDYAAVIDWALDTWANVSGFDNLGRVPDGGANFGASEELGGQLGDIRVAAWELSSSSLVAHAFQPGTEAIYGLGGTVAGDLHFDVNRQWIDDPFAPASTARYDIYTVALHEIGHALGLGHSTLSSAVMHNGYHGARRSLSSEDVLAIRALYGVPEPSGIALVVVGGLTVLALRRRLPARRRSATIPGPPGSSP